MTPGKDKNTESDGAAVALEEEVKGGGSLGERTEEDARAEADGHTAAMGSAGGGADAADQGGVKPQDGPREAASAMESPGGESLKKAEFQEVSASPAEERAGNLDLLLDVVVPVSVELGRTSLTVKDILATCQGSVIELDRAAGEAVDIMVGGKPLARGEVVVVKDRFGVRITELTGSIEGLGRA